ncbi:hypothetical protein Ndes2526B_g04985 [Nannochloris sp. 'desiccata']|nr:hypothetical protein KSW81_006141 [Chlorella desiccata (nom. nud.)]KAH7619713.1 hypothetical protein NADE_008001 [Chlorella desiccata (nom. nud.)]
MQVSDKKAATSLGHASLNIPSGGPHERIPLAAAPGGGAHAGRASFPFAFAPHPDPSDLKPLVVSPSSKSSLQAKQQEETKSEQATAFIFLPGAFMYPKDYSALAAELKTAFKTLSTNVWLILAAVDWSQMNSTSPSSTEQVFNTAIEDALKAAEDAGFIKSSSSFSGRFDNVFIGMHSMSVLAASGFPFHRSAGAVLFGASMVPTDTFWPFVHTYPRPVLHIFGEMDGQAHQCRAALSAAEAALSAPSLGRKCAARECPIAIIEGMNHAQFSNGKVNYNRGDLDPFEKEQKAALEEVAAVVGAFLTAHSAPPLPQAQAQEENFQKKEAAIDVLEDVTMRAARHFTPYLRALGRTAAEDLLLCTEGACDDTTACYGLERQVLAHPLAYSHGAEYLCFDSPSCSFTAHPGELHTAERFAIRAQKQLLESAGLPSEIVKDISMAAVSHTSRESFIYSQPVILQCKEAPHGFVLKVHILLQREAYPEGKHAVGTRAPTALLSPTYALKLKSGEQIAYAVKEMSPSLENPEQLMNSIHSHRINATYKHTHISRAGGKKKGPRGEGSRLSAEVYEEALVQVGARAREIFQNRGFELVFIEDRRGGPHKDGRGDHGRSGSGAKKEIEKAAPAAVGDEAEREEHAEDAEQQPPKHWEKASDWIDTPMVLSKDTAHSTIGVESDSGRGENKTRNKSCTAVVPAVYVDSKKEGPFDEGPSRFVGAVHFKAPSLAWCMEWILVAGLRNE